MSEELHHAMFSVLVGNKPEFVSLLLKNGVSLKHFFQEERLDDLYVMLPKCMFERRLAKYKDEDRTNFIKGVSREAHQLLKSYTLPILPDTANLTDRELSTASDSENFLESGNPARDLFLWAILHNNKELAEIAWEECKDSMASALAASKILKKLGSEIYREEDADEEKELKELASHYETRAIDVFNQCYSCDKERARKLLLRVSPFWDGATCLTLALEANNQNFIAQSGVQALLTQIWCGELSVENAVWRVLVCIVFFPLIYTRFLDFRRNEEIRRGAGKKVTKASEDGTISQESIEEVELKPLGVCARLVSLYRSLQVKFYMHIVSYFAFLALFAVVLMIDFHPSPSNSEMLLYIWTFTLVCEEIRQLFDNPNGLGCWIKAKHYIYDFWNVLDVLSIILFIIGVAFRFNDGDGLIIGKIVLCIDFIIFCLRLMAIFIINQTLGPKLIIVKRMMMDMFFFLFLLSIWVVAYGVAKQGILVQNEGRLDWILRGAVYEPYLILFGEMPSNIDHAAFEINKCSKNGSDPLKPKCPMLNENEMPVFPQWLTIIMLCVYLLFANILLLNLLIAILSFTFQVVQDNTDRIWKFHRYELIYEYHSRPIAPPPFIFFCHLYQLLRAVLRGLRKASKCCRKCPVQQLEEDKGLLEWEALMKDRYLASTMEARIRSTDQRIQDTAHKVSSICDRLDREEDPSFGSVHKRLAQLEQQVTKLFRDLERNIDSVKSLIKASPNKTDADRKTCFPVPGEMVPCESSCYNPRYYYSPDSWDGTDRNPGGRASGVHSRPRPICKLDLILTRCRDRGNLEFLVLKDESEKSLILPGGEVDSIGRLSVVLERTMGEEVCQKIKEMLNMKSLVYDGYVDDQRNTDDAWIETTVLTLDLTDSPLLTDINTQVTQTKGLVLEWHKVSSGGTVQLSSSLKDSMKKVAEKHNSNF